MSFVFAPPQQAVVPVQDETYSYFPIRRVFSCAHPLAPEAKHLLYFPR